MCLALWRMALSARCVSTISAFSADMPIERSRQPLASIARVGKRLFSPLTMLPSSLLLVLRRAFRAGELAQPLRHGFQPLGIAEDIGDEILLLHPRQGRGVPLQRFQQQLGRALDRGQRRFQFMGEMRREGRDVVRAPRELLGHAEKALRELREFAGAVMGERLEGVAVAARDAIGAADQLAHRPGDGAAEDEADQHRASDDGEGRQDELAALLIEMLEDVARGARGVDHAGDVVVDDHRHRREHVHADAAADGIDRRRRLVGHTDAQGGVILPLQRRRDLLDMGERLARSPAGRR